MRRQSAMPCVAYTDSQACRHYDVELPYHISRFVVGIAINQFKQIGVWNKLPHSLKDKAKAAKANWAGLKITQKDLDSISDDAWETIAVALRVKWRYAKSVDNHGPTLLARNEPALDMEGVQS